MIWFFPNREGMWEVYYTPEDHTPEEFVGAWPTYAEAVREARTYADKHGIKMHGEMA